MTAETADLWYRRILSGLFIMVLVLPLMKLLLGDREWISSIENRSLAEAPSAPHSVEDLKRLPREISAFFDDHFGYREALVASNRAVLRALGAGDGSGRVLTGKDDWLFYTVNRTIDDYRGRLRFTEEELASWQLDLTRKFEWLRERNIAYLFVIAPNKHSIYPEYLPEWLQGAGGETLADRLLEHLRRNTDVPVLDLREPLRRAKSGPLLYFKMDTHWNAWGANHAQYEIMRALAASLQGVAPLRFEEKDIAWRRRPGGDLTHMAGISGRSEPVPAFPELKARCLRAAQPGGAARPGKERMSEDRCSGQRQALIFHDSFMNQLRPFLSAYFDRSTYLWSNPDFCTVKELALRLEPAVVIEQRVERLLISPHRPGCGVK